MHCFASWATSRGLLNLLDPRGPRARISCPLIRLRLPRFPYIFASLLQPGILDYSAYHLQFSML